MEENPLSKDKLDTNSKTSRERGIFLEALLINATTLRRQLYQSLSDPRRDIDDACGYPKGCIPLSLYQHLYEREGVATRVVHCMPEETWQTQPEIYEDEDINVITPFEEAWNSLPDGLQTEKDYLKEESSGPIWEILQRADIVSGIEHYGVILLGIDDSLPLDQPVRGVTESNSIPSPADKEGFNTAYLMNEEQPVAYSIRNEDKTGSTATNKLIYLRVYPEYKAKICSYETNKSSPRYGQPTAYIIDDSTEQNEESSLSYSSGGISRKVHWTRIIHIADNLSSGPEVFGTPRMQPVLNRLLDLPKLYGGSAEMYWRGAFPGLSFETQPGNELDPEFDSTSLKNMYEEYANDLQRALFLSGMTVKSLAPQVVVPNQQIDAIIDAICIQLGIPKRIFLGSERGELASSQDAKSWSRRVKKRQSIYAIPKIIRPFVNRLIFLGVLPRPKSYTIFWPELEFLSESEQANVSRSVTTAMVQYITGNVYKIVPPLYYFTRVLGFKEQEVKLWIKETEKKLEELEKSGMDTSQDNTVGRNASNTKKNDRIDSIGRSKPRKESS